MHVKHDKAILNWCLRTLEERTIRPVGSNKEIPIDIRVVSATNRDLKESVAQNTFRNDLFYRLNTFTIHVPPLRDRHEDIPLLAHHPKHKVATFLRNN